MFRRYTRMIGSRCGLLQLSDTIGRILWKAAIVLLILLVLFQAALQNESFRAWVSSAEWWEGTRLN